MGKVRIVNIYERDVDWVVSDRVDGVFRDRCYKQLPEHLLTKYLLLRMVDIGATIPDVGFRAAYKFGVFVEE